MPGAQFSVGRTDIEIVVRDESVITGRVVDSDSGKGAAGVTLLARADKGEANYFSNHRTISGEDGRFRLSGLPADDYSVQVVAPYEGECEWVGRDVKVTVGVGESVKNVDVPVNKGAMVEVCVKSADTGDSIEGASVYMRQKANFGRHDCFYKCVYCDNDGLAVCRVPAGECTILASGDKYIYFRDPESIKVIEGKTYRKTIELSERPSLEGVITDLQGNPVRNALVASKPTCDHPVLSDANGTYEVIWYERPEYRVPKRFLLVQDQDKCQAGLVEIKPDTETLDVALKPAHRLSGRIVDPNGKGIHMASVKLRASIPGWYTTAARGVLTDAHGGYEIGAVPAQIEDFKYSIEIDADGYGPIQIGHFVVEGDPNTTIKIDDLVLQPTDESISGIVVDANDNPVAGIELFVTGPRGSSTSGQPGREGVTDKQGRFDIQGVCKGPLRIQAGFSSGKRGAGFLEAEGGDEDVKVVLGKRLIHERYQSLTGKPLNGLDGITIDYDRDQSKDKVILLCFFDMQQRPSRHCVTQLAKRAEELEAIGVTVIGVQASKVERDALDDWAEKQNVTFSVGIIEGQETEVRLRWGVKSLPWLILTDKEHIVTVEGFALSELSGRVGEIRDGVH
jgi:hypothetical protein